MKAFLSFPAETFTKDFLDIEVRKELGIRGNMIPYYLKEKTVHKPTTGLFSRNMFYCCKIVNNNVILIGASK